MKAPRSLAIIATILIHVQCSNADEASIVSRNEGSNHSTESAPVCATAETCSSNDTANGITPPDLSECALLGRNIARTKYYEEMLQDMRRMSAKLQFTASLYSACHLFSGAARNACCQRIMERSISQCQSGVLAEEKLESPCAPRQIDCRLLRPAKCLLERAIERKRVQCCIAIDGQVLKHLLNHCKVVVEQVSADCKVPEGQTTEPVSVSDDPADAFLESPIF